MIDLPPGVSELISALVGSGVTGLGLWFSARKYIPRTDAEARRIESEARSNEWRALVQAAREHSAIIAEERSALQRAADDITAKASELQARYAECAAHRQAQEEEIGRLVTQRADQEREIEGLRGRVDQLQQTVENLSRALQHRERADVISEPVRLDAEG